MKKLYQVVLTGLISLILLITVFLSLLVYSPVFNNWLIVQVSAMVPGLSIAKAEGLLLGDLQIYDLHYASDEVELSVKSFAYRFKLSNLLDTQLLFETLYIDGVEVVLLESTAPPEEDNDASAEFIMPVTLAFQDFSLRHLQVKQQDAHYLFEHIHLALWYQGQQLQLSQVAVESDIVQLQGKANLTLNTQLPFQADLIIAKMIPEFAQVKAQLAVQGDLQKIYLDAALQSPAQVSAKGWVELGELLPRFDLQLAWSALQWPLQGTKQYASENARMTLKGTAEQYHVTLDSKIFAQDMAAEQIHLLGQGDSQQLTFSELSIKALNGELQTKGRFSWTDTIPSDLQIQASHIQLDSVLPDYPGILDLDAQVSGALLNKLDMQINIKHLQGNLMGQAVKGQASVRYQPEVTDIKQALVSVGRNSLSMQGKLGKKNQLTFKLDAADMQQLSPDLAGSVYADGMLQGDLTEPTIDLDVHADKLSFQQQKVEKIQATVRLVTAGEGLLDVDARLENINLDGIDIHRVELHSMGQLAEHRIYAQVDSSKGNIDLALQGAWRPQEYWQGELEYLQLSSTPVGDWKLIKSAPLELIFAEQKPIQVQTDMCLAQKGATGLLCVHAKSDKKSGQSVDGYIKRLPLSVFAQWLPENLAIESDLQTEFSLTASQGLSGNMTLSLDPGELRVMHEELGLQIIRFNTAQMDIDISPDKLDAELSLVMEAQKRIDGQIQIRGLDNIKTARLDGTLDVRMDSLGFVNALNTVVEDIEGAIDAKVKLQGLLTSPTLNGTKINLSKGQLKLAEAGLSVSDFHFEAVQTETQHLVLIGGADIQGQKLAVKGQIENYANDQLQFKLAINGENLQVLQLPDMQVWASPDLHLSGNKKGAKLSGDVTIPKAVLLFASLPEGAIALSDDEVIVSDELTAPKVPAYPFDMNINILLGDAVSIEGFGLKSRLEGKLRAELQAGGFKLFNELNLVDGTYQAYGQDLSIKKGQLLFAGEVDNTGINMLAYRKASDWNNKTIAYLSMTGMLTAPVTRIYTEPALSESESLAYLLTGAALGGSSGSNAMLIAKAALGLGKDYVEAVMETVGIDEFEIKSTSVGQNSMVLGKRIGPNLYARYIVDILSSQMQLAVEYQWNKNISIETRAGATHSSDIKYNIEFD